MKKTSLIPLLAFLFFVSCGNPAAKESKKDDSESSSSESSAPLSGIAKTADDAQKRMEELKSLQPISNESLKSVFPEEVMGMKRSSFSVSSTLGYSVGTAEYRKDDTTKYQISIYDCAGEAGSAFYGMSYLTRLNMEREDDNGYEKTVSFMDTKAIETYKTYNNEYNLSFVTAERFWVSLESQNTGLDNLKSFAQALNLDRLKDLK